MLDLATFCQILAWPLVALCALGASVWVAYDFRRPTDAEVVIAELAASRDAVLAHVSKLAERVGQLEIAQGVKRGR